MPSVSLRYAVFLGVLLLQLVACGGGDSSGSTDTTAPTVISQTPTTSLLGVNDTVTIQFSESIDTSSYILGGNLAAASDGGVWSQTNTISDTLTISPQTTWPVDSERKLIIDARDLAGNALATMTLTKEVYRGTLYYVSAAAPDDTGDGLTPVTAKQTIMAAINAASSPATVLVEAGVYSVSVSATPRITLKEGVSLYGGYNPGFGDREAGGSTIVDQSVYTTTLQFPNYAVIANAGITSATLLDGFTILGADSGSNITAGLRMRDGAAPIVQNNTINGGSGSSYSFAIHLYNDSGSPQIQHNTIYGGSGPSSHGIYADASTMQVQSNTINGGSGITSSTGIAATRSAPSIENNLIYGGQGSSSMGVYNVESNITLRNNTIHGGTGSNQAYGVQFTYSQIIGSGFTIENNIILTQNPIGICIKTDFVWSPDNNVLQCPAALYQYLTTSYFGINNAGNLTINADGSGAELSPAGSNNMSVDPQLADIDGADNNINTMDDNDWHLSASTPASVTAGGLNGVDQGWSFTTDKDGIARPASGSPWSIGAYEPAP